MANFNLNKVILGGRLCADPELRQTNSGIMVTSVGLAVNRKYQGADQAVQTDFFNLVAWRTTAEFITKHFRKGSSVCVVGQVQVRNYTDAQGAKRTSVDVVADEVYFVDSKSEQVQGAAPAAGAASGANASANDGNYEVLDDESDLPF